MSQSTQPQYDLVELARPLITLLDEYQHQFTGWAKIHQLMLEGRPVSPGRIAAHLGLSEEEVADLLKGAELDQKGNLVGVGLSISSPPLKRHHNMPPGTRVWSSSRSTRCSRLAS